MERLIEENVKERNEKIAKDRIFTEQIKKDNESRAKTMNLAIKTNIDKIRELNSFKDDTKEFEESMLQ